MILRIISSGEDDPAISAIKHRIGRKIGVGIAHQAGHLARDKVIHRLIGHDRGCHIQKRHVDMLTAPRDPALHKGSQDRRGGIDAGEDIGHRDAHLLRLTLWVARDAHQPGHALDDEVIARAVGIGAGLAKPGDRAIDQTRVHFRQAGIIQPVFLKPADLEILNHHIGVSHQTAHRLLPLGRAEIAGDAALAPVGGVKVGGGFLAFAVDEGRPPAAGVIALGGLDLDHVCAKIGKGLARPRAGQNSREFDNLDAGKWSGHVTWPTPPRSAISARRNPCWRVWCR